MRPGGGRRRAGRGRPPDHRDRSRAAGRRDAAQCPVSAAAIEQFTDPERYDAVAFTVARPPLVEVLAPALARVAELLVPGGVLVVDDFDLRAPDEAAALWLFELQELFAVAGLYDPARIDGKASHPPVARWLCRPHRPRRARPPPDVRV